MKIWVPALLNASLLATGLGIARAQTPATPPAKPLSTPTDYPNESIVFDSLTRSYTYAADGTGTRQITGVIEVRNQAGVKSLSVIPFDFASSAEHVEIDYVRVHHADGSIVLTPISDAQELPADVTREAPFYSDLKQEQIPIRSLQPGDLLEYQLRIVRTKPEAPGHFWGAESFFLPSREIVIRSEVVELHVPKDAYVQVWSPNYKPTTTDTATDRTYRWQSSQLAPTAGQKKSALLQLDHNPTLGTNDDPPLPHIAWTNFHSWQEVGAWYRSLEGSRTAPDDDIRAKVATLIAGKSTPDEKARAIYAYVSSQVRYIGVAFGIGRFQPHNASDVLSNQYGDCKDKSTLLISMLAAANIPADAVLIGAGITFNPVVPSPASFNHAITLAHLDNQPAWLDSTAEASPFSLLNPFLRDKHALVIPATGDAHVETTPADPPFPSTINFQATGTLDDKGVSHSQITMDFRGDGEVELRQAVRTVSPAQWDDLMQRISYGLSFGGKVTNTQFSRPDDTLVPFHVAYDYEREKAGDWDNLRIVPQILPVGLLDADEKDPPVVPIELGNPHTEIDHAVMTLPAGWTANLPPSVHAKTTFASLTKTYKFEHGILTTDRQIQIFQKSIPASEWKAYHQWYKDAGLDGEAYVQLNPAASSSSTVYTTPLPDTSLSNPEAQKLVQQARQAELHKDFSGARTLLDQAKILNPEEAYLWSSYAALAAQDHNRPDVIADLQKELSFHPSMSAASRKLAAAYLAEKKPQDAIATLQAAIVQNPSDVSLVIDLSAVYTQQDDSTQAETALRSGLETNPTNSELQVELGQALLREKKTAEATTLLRAVATTSSDSLQLNNAAYALADSSLDLDLAEITARKALRLLDEASNNGETGPNAVNRTALIVSAWDTYGWILYRDNKIAEAEPWIRAAWRNSQSAETGYHLAMILERQKHLPEALHQLELAAKGRPANDPAPVQKLIDDETSKLRTAIPPTPKHLPNVDANAQHTVTVTAPFDPVMALHDQRSYQVPRGNTQPSGNGSAAVQLEVTNLGTTSFTILSGDQSLQPLSDAVQHLKLDLQFPPTSHAKIVRLGLLSCHTGPTCALLLLSTDGGAL